MRVLKLLLVSVVLISVGATTASGAARRVKGCGAARRVVNGRTTCLVAGRRCSLAARAEYLRLRWDCARVHRRYVLRRASRAALRQGRVLDLSPSGLPTFRQALWEFDQTVARLPGVRVPTGAVGSEPSGTGAIASLDRFRGRLTRRQRAVLNRVLKPAGGAVTVPTAPTPAHAAVAPGVAELVAITAQATSRLVDHHIFFKHQVTIRKAATQEGVTDQANTDATWLYGTGSTCAISVLPSGWRSPLSELRVILVHELMHCAAAEQLSRSEFDRQPMYVQEGLPEWAAYRVGIEWQGTTGPDTWWPVYLKSPQISVFSRSYDAVGVWSLFEHEGVDLWSLHPALVKAGGSGTPTKAFQVAKAAAAPSFEDEWGSTLATQASLGTRWDLAGPGMTPRSEPQASVGNGETWGRAIGQAAGFESRIDISADVIRVRKVSSVKGWLRDGAGMDRPIPTDERFCTDGSGCVCPDGKKLGYTEIQPGDARIGYADTAQPGSVVITGESLDEHCKVQPVGALTVRGGQGLAILATFKSGTCSVTKGQFQAKAKDGGWSIVVHIPHFAGYGQVYPLRVGSSAEFVITGPGGPYSNANPPPNHGPAGGEIRFYPNGSKMSLGFEYAWNPSARNGVLPIGAMTCKRPKR